MDQKILGTILCIYKTDNQPIRILSWRVLPNNCTLEVIFDKLYWNKIWDNDPIWLSNFINFFEEFEDIRASEMFFEYYKEQEDNTIKIKVSQEFVNKWKKKWQESLKNV
jgi:hypothetical protein